MKVRCCWAMGSVRGVVVAGRAMCARGASLNRLLMLAIIGGGRDGRVVSGESVFNGWLFAKTLPSHLPGLRLPSGRRLAAAAGQQCGSFRLA